MALPSNSTPINDPGDINPTTLIMKYLTDHNTKINSGTIRQVLEANAREGGSLIPELRNSAPSTEAEDQAAMAASRGGSGGGQRGSGGSQALPVPPIPPGSTPTDQTSSAPPSGNTTGSDLDTSGISPAIAALLGVPAIALGAYGVNRLRGGSGPAPATSSVPTVGGSVPPPVDPGAGIPGQGEVDYTQLDPRGNRLTEPGSMESAMQKSQAPVGPEPVQPQMEGVRPYQPTAPGVQPLSPEILAQAQRGASTTDPAVLNETTIRSGAQPPPRVPFTPRPGGGVRVPSGPFANLGRLLVR